MIKCNDSGIRSIEIKLTGNQCVVKCSALRRQRMESIIEMFFIKVEDVELL